jgi:SAM-dependent methyltransferase
LIDRRLLDRRLAKLEIGSAEWFRAQRQLIEAKPLIRRCYQLWYSLLLRGADSAPDQDKYRPIIELGSGGSFLSEVRAGVIRSDVAIGNVDAVFDGRALPFRANSVRALLLTHVFHHIPDVAAFLREAQRVLIPGGVVSMVDCTHTPFARFFFRRFHPEPYDDKTSRWEFPPGHSMLDSNQALTWLVFFRDRHRLESVAADLVFEQWHYLPWLSYLLSGGVNLPSFVPGPLVPLVLAADVLMRPLDPLFAVHWHLTVRKRA